MKNTVLVHASALRRIFAMSIDSIILVLVSIGIAFLFTTTILPLSIGLAFTVGGILGTIIPIAASVLMYFFLVFLPLFWFAKGESGKRSGTLGKRIMKLKVLSKKNGSRITFKKAFVRTLIMFLVVNSLNLLLFIFWKVPFWLFLDPSSFSFYPAVDKALGYFFQISPFIMLIATGSGIMRESKNFSSLWDRMSKTIVCQVVSQAENPEE